MEKGGFIPLSANDTFNMGLIISEIKIMKIN